LNNIRPESARPLKSIWLEHFFGGTTMRKTLAVLGLAAAVTSVAVLSIANAQNKEAYIGLITKTESNPFFVKMKEGAQKEATRLGAKFISAAGKQDGDNAGQVAAMENMVAAGVNTILLTASEPQACKSSRLTAQSNQKTPPMHSSPPTTSRPVS
jgi:ABC-type sugar transport system substrate-binding protein